MWCSVVCGRRSAIAEQDFARLVENTQGKPERFCSLASQLFAQMATGGDFGADRIEHFNGNLFDTIEALELTTEELRQLLTVSKLDWSNIDASIFGTLFERALVEGCFH